MRRIDRGYLASRSGELGKDVRRRNKEAKIGKRVDRPLHSDIRATASDGKARVSAWGLVVELLNGRGCGFKMTWDTEMLGSCVCKQFRLEGSQGLGSRREDSQSQASVASG